MRVLVISSLIEAPDVHLAAFKIAKVLFRQQRIGLVRVEERGLVPDETNLIVVILEEVDVHHLPEQFWHAHLLAEWLHVAKHQANRRHAERFQSHLIIYLSIFQFLHDVCVNVLVAAMRLIQIRVQHVIVETRCAPVHD